MPGWVTVDWLTVAATVTGGAAALLGSVVAHALGTREQRRRSNSTERRDAYVAYLVALDDAFGAVRHLAGADIQHDDIEPGIQRAFRDAGLYRSRERLLLAGNPAVLSPAELVLRRLAAFRDAVRAGAKRRTVAYHDAYHPFAEALWDLRRAIRKDLGSEELTLADLEKETWDTKSNCVFCRTHAAPVPTQPVAAGV
jgi:hypothetical protein